MRLLALTVLVAACNGSPNPPPITGSASTGCDFQGRYRLRYSSNGMDGWWLRFRVDGSSAVLTAEAGRLGLDKGPIETAFDARACKLTLSATNQRAGELRIELSVAPSGRVTGTLARTRPAAEAATPIVGLHESSRPELPPCLHPGVYEIAAQGTWQLSSGHPTLYGCADLAEPAAQARVRVEAFGSEIVVEEVGDPPDYEQGFGHGTATRTGACTFTLSFAKQSFKLDGAKLTFDGDGLAGIAAVADYEFYENENTGENHWACTAKQPKIVGKRVAPDLI